ncbi:MAG: hypothetical protein UY19_C0031G0001, partial [Candidatus Wolfebacteria bacterium GW2011_GWA2_47_9b]
SVHPGPGSNPPENPNSLNKENIDAWDN